MDMQEILAAFASEPLFSTSEKFLKYLGVKTSTQTADPIPFLEMYEDAAKDAGAEVPKSIKKLFGRVEETYFIGSVDDDTLHSGKEGVSFQVECQNPKYEGMFVFAVRMKDGEELTRTDAALLTRGINRLVHQQPAIVLILEDTLLSVATCERTPYKQTWRPGEKLGKVSILKGVNCLNPHRGHIDILESMNVKKAKTFDALYEQWQKVFSTSILTNKFYNELFDWYCWAVNRDTDVYFPNRPDDDTDDYEGNDTKIIRLITRIMFVWFIKQKDLVPGELFDPIYLRTILKDFNPNAQDSGCYYNAILQNLFFATLNRAVEDEDGKRRFADEVGHVDAKNLYRYDELFTISRDEIVALFSEIPFVNGSLFDCLDKTKGNDGVEKAFYADGFSRNDKRVPSTNHYKYRAFVPNNLFFDPDNGLFSIFARYNFTVEENTPLEQQVALDPELLGKVFENLLGVYNPETQETARKQSGSFYTPREKVNYMVDQALISYLGATPLVKRLFSEQFVYDEMEWAEYQTIAAKLKTVKILDPACGSGAFPVGMLNRIVEILQKLRSDSGNVFKLKRHIIENCIYGGDIQCIAAQITKLRFFISLIVNCEKDLAKPNFGIPELPNLETKFVAANSLVGVSKAAYELHDPQIDVIKEQLRKVRHDHFNAHTAAKKRKLVKEDERLRKELSNCLFSSLTRPEDAEQLAGWNPYDQNTSAGFFDPEWMFGIKEGFDIVIGNPPYVIVPSADPLKPYYDANYEVATGGKRNLYHLFFEKGISLCKQGGVLVYITPDTYFAGGDTIALREYFLKNVRIDHIVHFTEKDKVFENVTQAVAIAVMLRGVNPTPFEIRTSKGIDNIDPSILTKDTGYLFKGFNAIIAKMKMQGRTFGDVCAGFKGDVNLGIKKAFFHDDRGADMLPLIRGIQISSYVFFGSSEWCEKIAESRGHTAMARVVFQEVANAGLVHRVKGTILKDVILGDSVNYVYPSVSDVTNELILAVLNSKAVNYYFKFFNQTNHVPIGEFKKIPFPDRINEYADELTALVKDVLMRKQENVEADTSTIEARIDDIVFALYALSDEDRSIILASEVKEPKSRKRR